jgi:hypothetical protein
LSAIELAYGSKAIIEPGQQVKIRNLIFNIDALNQVSIGLSALPALQYIPFHDFLNNQTWANKVKNKIVIPGYNGPKIHKVETEAGLVSAHELFVQVLKVLLQNTVKN